MRVAIVHDDLVQWGGAERILFGLSEIFPDAPIYTSLFNEKNKLLREKFKTKKVITSFLQKIPFSENLYKAFLPFYGIAFEQFDFSEFDLVISQTTRFSKSIITKPETLHICYCHTPPRFLWHLSGISENKFLKPLFSKLRIFDQISANRVDKFLAGSENAKNRISKIYQKNSIVLYPFVDEIFFQSEKSFNGDFFLIISRLNNYKKIDIAIEAFNELGLNLKIVGNGPEKGNLVASAKQNIEFLESVSNELLINLIAGCSALIVPGEEDFGLVSLEAQAMGKPVIAFKSPGLEETVIAKQTGIFFDSQTKDSLRSAVNKFHNMKFNSKKSVENAKKFNFENFKENILKELIYN